MNLSGPYFVILEHATPGYAPPSFEMDTIEFISKGGGVGFGHNLGIATRLGYALKKLVRAVQNNVPGTLS